MLVTIRNDTFEAGADSMGAELHFLRRRGTGREYLWNGDPSVWKSRAPILFPCTGRIKDGYTLIGGKRYAMPIHGFARTTEHRLIRSSGDEMEWELKDTDETTAVYPYRFSLRTRYAFDSGGLVFETRVKNTGAEPMYFSIGSHTALLCPFDSGSTIEDYRIEFEKKEPLTAVCLTETGYLAGGTKPFERADGTIPLRGTGFGTGLFITGFTSSWAGIRNGKTGELVRIQIAGFPGVMFWQNEGKPKLVCIEPWHCLPVVDTTVHLFCTKPGIVRLEPGEEFACSQSIWPD